MAGEGDAAAPGMTLRDVKLPASEFEARVSRQVTRLRELASRFSKSSNEALSDLGDTLEDIAGEVEKAVDEHSAEDGPTLTEEIKQAINAAR